MAKTRKKKPSPKKKTKAATGKPAPSFRLQADDGNWVSLNDLKGKNVVLYFYPKDDTPGCTKEACAFRDGISKIQAKGAVVYGVSADDVESHRRFKEKYNLNFPLLADVAKKTVQDYGVWKEKNMYGRTYMGIERTTFLIGEDGRIRKIFPKVNVEVHYDEVLKALGE
jgi:peroxiredoxin Q/BCP